ncbi:site-specific integrase [Methylobacterium iners]|uniref:Tyrosine recombinase XerC n=1 Tax=Methylobacterium iners TaxID=418707 RepID=A0ABQ4RSG1_9HYPH|nr:site-specific integrase [Methylobacterium iners]GJD93127.1 Tyrosine recombinase XerC [Methylobacterium iners]
MARLVNVTRRAGIFHFRRVVPLNLRARLQRRELVRSLGTTCSSAAKLRADLLYRESERLFVAASTMLPQDQLARLVQDFYTLVLDIDDHRRLLEGALEEEDHAFQVAFLEDLINRHRSALARNQFEDVELATSVILRRQGITPESLGPGEHNQIRQAILRAGIDLAQQLRARYDGNFNYEPRDKLLQTPIAATPKYVTSVTAAGAIPSITVFSDSLPPVTDTPAVSKVQASASLDGPLLSVVGQEFRRDQHSTKTWDAQTANQASATYRLFIEACGDRPLAAYGRPDADRFRKQVSLMPCDYSKAVQYRGLTVPQIVEKAEVEAVTRAVKRLSQRTVKRHFSALSALWSSSISAGAVKENIFAGFRFAAAKRAKDQRPMWLRSELRQLLSTPVWTGCKSDVRRGEPGSLILRDEYYWIPLIGVFSGMRQEEICQLHVADVREEEGITFFDLNERPPRKLKNATAVRRVPVHKELVRLGLLDHVTACRRAGEALLFSNLTRGGADARLGHAFSKWFTRYRQEQGLYRSGLDFHALRHTATTLMHQADANPVVVDHVTGHTTEGETSRYTKGSTLLQLQDAINLIDLHFDVTSLALTKGLKVTTGPGRKPHPSTRKKRAARSSNLTTRKR